MFEAGKLRPTARLFISEPQNDSEQQKKCLG